jgi:hypothetical protein
MDKHVNKTLKLFGISSFLLLQVGCASITGSRNQPISVTTTHEGRPISGAYCTLVNSKGTFYVNTPGSVVILKAFGDMTASCKKEESHVGVSTFQSSAEGATWGNIVAGGLIGYAVDASTGAGFSYPPTLNIEMVKGNVMPLLPVAIQPASATTEAAPSGVVATQSLTTTTTPTPARQAITPATPAPTTNMAPNPAKRLEGLNELLKNKLITQSEYDKKKAEILNTL